VLLRIARYSTLKPSAAIAREELNEIESRHRVRMPIIRYPDFTATKPSFGRVKVSFRALWLGGDLMIKSQTGTYCLAFNSGFALISTIIRFR